MTGGIAAYKACELVRLFVKAGHEVTPVLTSAAERFVAAETFAALARKESPRELYPHLTEADLLVVAPLSANTLAKLACGLAESVLTELALAFRGPRLAAPAMNARMWEHPATQRNVATLGQDGWHLIGPEAGELAEGEVGMGRMSEPEAIFARALELVQEAGDMSCGKGDRPRDVPGADACGEGDRPRDVRSLDVARGDMAGLRVVVSAGGTREPVDTVRYLGNRSSGRMGVALAAEARRRGADVTLLYANGAVDPPTGIEVVQTPTAADLAREALARADADVIVMAAAVADYRPAERLEGKHSKGREAWTVTLEPTQDVLAELGRRRRPGQILVGFAADEGERGLARAREKLANKGGNLFVFNDVSRSDIGFDSEENEVVLLSAHGERTIGKRSKEECAVAILDEISTLLREA